MSSRPVWELPCSSEARAGPKLEQPPTDPAPRHLLAAGPLLFPGACISQCGPVLQTFATAAEEHKACLQRSSVGFLSCPRYKSVQE